MRKAIFFAMAILIFSACSKDDEAGEVHDPVKQAIIDDALILAHFEENNITEYEEDPSGLYYRILDDSQATGATVPSYQKMTVRYKGMFMDGEVFEENSTTGFLSQYIKGWQIGIPKLRLKEKALLYIPSGLAYGSTGSGSISANTVLKFEVKVLEVSQ